MSTPDLPVITGISFYVEERGDGFHVARVVSVAGKLGIWFSDEDPLTEARLRIVNLTATSRSRRKAIVYLLRAVADELEAIR